jgi:hypothetical protein
VDVGAISLVHFVELIDATDSSISENKCTTFKKELSCNLIFNYCSGKTNT